MGSVDGREYSIDQLAARTGVPTRTIRYYQSKQTLPPPERRGRVAVYGDDHVERLRLIASLQERGLSLNAIREAIEVLDKGGTSLEEWLGVSDRLQAPWTDDRPLLISHQDLMERMGDRTAGFLGEAARQGIVERRGDHHPPSYLVASPRMLDIAVRLDAAGVDLTTALGAERILRRRLGKAADELVEWFTDHLGQGFGGSGDASGVAESFDALRPLGSEAAQLIFGQEMERSLRRFVERGGVVTKRKR